MTKEQLVLISLLKIVVSQKPDKGLSEVNWLKVLDLATEQGVMAVAFEAIELLESDKRPDIDTLMEWLGQASYSETDYEQHQEAITELADIFNTKSIKMMLLKGYGLSLNYPIPKHRPCGDIDIYLYGRQKEGDNVIKSIGIDVNDDNPHHSTFTYKDITVENHRTFLDQDNHKSNIHLEGFFRELLSSPQTEITVGGQKVFVPSPTLNAIYLVRHAGEHFATEKITLRHVLDIGTFLQKNSDEIDWDFVQKVYWKENMTDFYNAIATICQNHLGFQSISESFKGFQEMPELADRVLEDIFATTEGLPMSTSGIKGIDKVKYGIKKSLRLWNNRWKYKMVYDECLLESFWTLAINRIRH